jgi:AraC-like DNA-binding protein
VANDVGYESEAAFNRAFKRRFDTPPARYRREARAVGPRSDARTLVAVRNSEGDSRRET